MHCTSIDNRVGVVLNGINKTRKRKIEELKKFGSCAQSASRHSSLFRQFFGPSKKNANIRVVGRDENKHSNNIVVIWEDAEDWSKRNPAVGGIWLGLGLGLERMLLDDITVCRIIVVVMVVGQRMAGIVLLPVRVLEGTCRLTLFSWE